MSKWSYFAGIIDGEGYLGLKIQRKRKQHHIQSYVAEVSVSNTNLELINWIHKNFGGRILTENIRKGKWKIVYIWRAYSNEISSILRNVKKYLIVKKEKAECILDYRKTIILNQGNRRWNGINPELEQKRRLLYLKVKKGNTKGFKSDDSGLS